MRSVEAIGKTVEEAIEKALQELGAKREDVEIEILQQPKLGGLIGQAKIRVTLKQTPGERAKEMMRELMNALGVKGEVAVREREEQIELEVAAQDEAALLIGRNGSTLLAIQTLLNAIINKGQEKPKRVKLDINDYMRRREERLKDLALKSAREVRLTRRPKVLESLNAAERKIIHNTLKDDPYVYTYSEGEEPNRKLIIAPKERGK